MKLKIGLVIDDSLDRANNGVQQYVLTLGEWLASSGHEVHYLCGETKRKDIANLHSLSRNLPVSFNQNKMSVPLPANKTKIRQLLEAEQFDVLHLQMPYSPYLSGRIAKLAPKRTALVGTFHIVPYSKTEEKAGRLLALYLSKNLKLVDAVISVSPAAQGFAKNVFKLGSQVLPNVVNLDYFAKFKIKRPKNRVKKIVFLGRLVPRKGCAELLKALAQVASDNWNLTIAGTGPLMSDLKKLSQRYQLEDKVSFAGYVTDKQKAELLAGADLAIFPALGGESFGIVLIEAMAAGAGAVIGGNNPGYKAVLESCRDSLVDPKDSQALSQKIEQFLKDENLLNKVHDCQQKLVKQYDVNKVGPQILKAYCLAIAKQLIVK